MKAKNENDSERFAGANWDPEVTITRHGAKRSEVTRKVLTKGHVTVECGALIAKATRLLRQGYEVRLSDAIRLIPMMSTDCKRMYPSAQTMGTFCDALADKKAKRIMWRGKEVDGEEVVREAAKRHEEFAAVTPDTMITCNVCGNRIRVGRAIANQ